MLPGKQYVPLDFAMMAWRRRWIIIAPMFLGAYAALVVSSRLPSTYQSEMLIQVVPQRVPDAYVRSTVTMRTVDRLAALNEQITSRTELERLIKEMDLYPRERASLPMQDVVERMRTNITVDPGRAAGNQDPDSFYVRFTYFDPDVATRVTERLGGLFIDVNARDRGNLAQQTNTFLQTQLEEAKKNLEVQEDRLKQFREQNAGRLPTQLQYNMQALQAAQQRAQSLVENLARDRDQKMLLQQMYADAQAEALTAPPVAPLPNAPAAQNVQANQPGALPGGTTAQKLAAARESLTALELRLKPEHPDVTRTISVIATLEAQLALESKLAEEAARAAAPNSELPLPPGGTTQEIARRERLQQQRAQIESVERQIQFREAEEQRVRSAIDDLQRRIEQVPGVESEWVALSRDYDTQQAAYKDLLTKAEAAKLAANLEQRQIGEQFRILDPARTPVRATGINRLQINAAGAALGLLVGFLLAALLELRDRTFHQSADIVEVLQLPVLALVPQVVSAADRQRARLRTIAVLAVTVVMICAGAAGFWTLQLWKYVV